MEPDPTSLDALWLAWQGGEAAAFERLYREVSPGLYALCLGLSRGTGVAADDLFQETCSRAVTAAGRYRPEGMLQAWLATIARNTFLDLLRRRPPGRRIGLDAVQAGPAGGDPEGAVDMLDALARLAPDLREALALRYLQGLSLPETARVQGVSLATAKRRVAEGLGILARDTYIS